ncbi:PP2C family protein-serine/threonine phosphatase [Streptomyces coelicoflavus]|uniref:PP2C family protein-serine/threonine phosphatase n=1 Tax=Streptomyces TaxID=1883 RepID=UPI0012922CE8|nr:MULTISPECIES: PP2C family protein-serine/threonine phosphatase [Streptomyces]MCX5038163.1 serine/threonine-protein phosphatase [Streptomyces coelicoflavus]QFX84244.1 SpoIIE family protein phosphatase [Streptomyces sp. SYP-A7193]
MNRFAAVTRALRAGAPHSLPNVLAASLAQHYGAEDVTLRLADYSVRSLQAVGLPVAEPVTINGSPAGRAFDTQEPLVEECGPTGRIDVHLPVTIRGDRMGVLSARLPADRYVADLVPQMQRLSEALGHEILVAERDTDLYVLARRATRLTLAAEMQWQLLPAGRTCTRPEFTLGAHLEPARAVFGDNYDWSVSADHLTLTVANGMGEGIEAALLTNLAVNALRNARRAGLDLVGQASLADQAVFAQYRGRAHISVLLLRLDLATGEVEAIDAGSPRLWRLRDGTVGAVPFDAQLPLGMFDETVFVPEHFTVRPGDRLLFASDGVFDAPSPGGDRYEERSLPRALAATRLLPPAQVPGAVLRDLAAHHGDGRLDDDALVLCLDWYGRTGEEPQSDGRDE